MAIETFDATIITSNFGEAQGLLVYVNEDIIQEYGEEEVCEILESHPWVIKQNLPIGIAWNFDEDPQVYSPYEHIVEYVGSIDPEAIPWNHQLTLDFSDDYYDYYREEEEEEEEE